MLTKHSIRTAAQITNPYLRVTFMTVSRKLYSKNLPRHETAFLMTQAIDSIFQPIKTNKLGRASSRRVDFLLQQSHYLVALAERHFTSENASWCFGAKKWHRAANKDLSSYYRLLSEGVSRAVYDYTEYGFRAGRDVLHLVSTFNSSHASKLNDIWDCGYEGVMTDEPSTFERVSLASAQHLEETLFVYYEQQNPDTPSYEPRRVDLIESKIGQKVAMRPPLFVRPPAAAKDTSWYSLGKESEFSFRVDEARPFSISKKRSLLF